MKININTEEYWDLRYGDGKILPENLCAGVHKNLYAKIVDFIFGLKNFNILDIGAGTGPISYLLNKRGFIFNDKRYVCVDFSSEGLIIAKKRCEFIETYVEYVDKEISNVNIPEKFFDIVVCSEVIEHVTDYQIVLNNVVKFLSNSGTFILSFPRGKIMIREHYHMKIELISIVDLLEKLGLNVFAIHELERWYILKSRFKNQITTEENRNDLKI
jgi:2-polyprenyl-3-methyl-5-hydroxy-6-metoxy-1,4-benzoquinol methylase